MKLANFEITNFRCFESLSIPFNPDVNVILGVNGAGKSALLDAIAISLFNLVRVAGDPVSGQLYCSRFSGNGQFGIMIPQTADNRSMTNGKFAGYGFVR